MDRLMPAIGRAQDIGAGSEAVGPERQHHGDGAAGDRYGVPPADVGRERLLEGFRQPPVIETGGGQDALDHPDFGIADVRLGQRYVLLLEFAFGIFAVGVLNLVGGGMGHAASSRSAITMPVAFAGSRVIFQQWSLLSTR